MQFIDSHIHLQDDNANNAKQIIARMKQLGFVKAVCVSAEPKDWDKTAEVARQNPDFVIPAFGLHPWYVEKAKDTWREDLEFFLRSFPKAWVGECGLDRLKAPSWQGQEEAFLVQAELAKKYQRPLNIHLLKAGDEAVRFLKNLPEKFVLHSFSGSFGFLEKAAQRGAYFSISPAVFKRKNALELIQKIPSERLLTESDAPYQSDYADIKTLVKRISELKNTLPEQISATICKNFLDLSVPAQK